MDEAPIDAVGNSAPPPADAGRDGIISRDQIRGVRDSSPGSPHRPLCIKLSSYERL
jgi:hypothetical protein